MKRYVLLAGLYPDPDDCNNSKVGWEFFVAAGDRIEDVKKFLTLTDRNGDRPYPWFDSSELFYCDRKGQTLDLAAWYDVIDMEICEVVEEGGLEQLEN